MEFGVLFLNRAALVLSTLTFVGQPAWLWPNANAPAVVLILGRSAQVIPGALGTDPAQVRAVRLYALIHLVPAWDEQSTHALISRRSAWLDMCPSQRRERGGRGLTAVGGVEFNSHRRNYNSILSHHSWSSTVWAITDDLNRQEWLSFITWEMRLKKNKK